MYFVRFYTSFYLFLSICFKKNILFPVNVHRKIRAKYFELNILASVQYLPAKNAHNLLPLSFYITDVRLFHYGKIQIAGKMFLVKLTIFLLIVFYIYIFFQQ